MQYKEVTGGICAPKGFAAAGVHCGIRANHTEKSNLLTVNEQHHRHGKWEQDIKPNRIGKSSKRQNDHSRHNRPLFF